MDVVVVDWDLEAPGLESFFLGCGGADGAADQLGLIDLLGQYRQLHANLPFAPVHADADIAAARTEAEAEADARARRAADLKVLREYLSPIDHALIDLGAVDSSPGRLRLLSAGWRAGGRFPLYANAVQAFDWNAFYAECHGHAYFDWLRESLARPGLADVVLIDSRTGVTEMGGVCTRQMADVVVVLAAPNRQNLDGATRMAESFLRSEVMAERDGRQLEILMVPSRIDVASSEVKIAFERDFARQTRRFMPVELSRLRRDFWDLRIPYVSKYAFMEQLAVGVDDGDPDLQGAFRLITAHLAWLAPERGRVRSLMRTELDRVFGSEETRALVAPGRLLTRALASLNADDRVRARRILLRMVNAVPADVGARDTPRLVAADAFDAEHRRVLAHLVVAGVVRIEGGSDIREASAALAHADLLATSELAGWVAEDREFLLWRQRLRGDIERWEADGRPARALLTDSALAQAVQWMESRPVDDLLSDEEQYLLASRRVTANEMSFADSTSIALRPGENIFISYRRSDSGSEANLITQYLRREFGADRVFLDYDSIRPGDDFISTIETQLSRAAAVVVVIGPEWSVSVDHGFDFINREIGLALRRSLPIVPVLVRGASMPQPESLPADLVPLMRIQALPLNLRFNVDEQLAKLAGALRSLLAGRTPHSSTSSLLDKFKWIMRRWGIL